MKKFHVLGIDIGGSGMKSAIVDCKNGKLITDRFRIETPEAARPKGMATVVAEIVDHFQWKGPVGCGFPAVLDRGVALTAANIDKTWIGTNVEKLFAKTTGNEYHAINDADAAGLAEIAFGSGRQEKGVIILLTIGTGIGSALFIDGNLVPNTEFGHMFFKNMIAEKYCSNTARKSESLEWDVWGKRFNEYLDHLERIFSPNLFIVGGGVSKPEKFSFYKKFLKTRAQIVPARFHNNAGIIGGAQAAWLRSY